VDQFLAQFLACILLLQIGNAMDGMRLMEFMDMTDNLYTETA